jgi:hypothetical protein
MGEDSALAKVKEKELLEKSEAEDEKGKQEEAGRARAASNLFM